ncbi:MAG: 30S ribosomal protein S8 [Planctomycetia bacterium]
MSMTDPVADLLTRIRNGLRKQGDRVLVRKSRLSAAVVDVLAREGFLRSVREVATPDGRNALEVELKYDEDGAPLISKVSRVSRPGRRVYKGVREIPRVLNGMGIAVLSTSRGVMSDREARAAGVGGEVLCEVW